MTDVSTEQEDERDEADRLLDPNPRRLESLFPSADEIAEITSAPPKGVVTIVAMNRANREVIPACQVAIDNMASVTNAEGAARLDLSNLADGEYDFSLTPQDVSEEEVGPDFPTDLSKERIWRAWKGRVRIHASAISQVSPPEWVELRGSQVRVRVQPLWMKPRTPATKRTEQVDLIIVHHTAGYLPGDCNEFLYNPKKGVHYLIASNGETYKFVNDDHIASHAGYSYWQGVEGVNRRSIGIEMSHYEGLYPEAQLASLLDLIKRIMAAHPTIAPNRIVGHSDVGITEPKKRPPKALGRKSSDPGSLFPWERIEALGFGLLLNSAPVPTDIYGGYFKAKPMGRLVSGDSDRIHRYGGEIIPTMSNLVKEVQNDLLRIGYLCDPAYGDYSKITERAVEMFQQHMFSGSRRLSDKPEGGDGRLDHATASMIKKVLASPIASSV